jgi:hypothetical protein
MTVVELCAGILGGAALQSGLMGNNAHITRKIARNL